MSHVTTCSVCGLLYEECAEESANDPTRRCRDCEMKDREARARHARIVSDTCIAEAEIRERGRLIQWLRRTA